MIVYLANRPSSVFYISHTLKQTENKVMLTHISYCFDDVASACISLLVLDYLSRKINRTVKIDTRR